MIPCTYVLFSEMDMVVATCICAFYQCGPVPLDMLTTCMLTDPCAGNPYNCEKDIIVRYETSSVRDMSPFHSILGHG